MKQDKIEISIPTEFVPIRVRYDPGWLAEFKAVVPQHARQWDADDKVWYIHPNFLPHVEKLIVRHFYVHKQTGLTYQASWHVLCLREHAPRELIAAAADTLAKLVRDETQRERIEAARWILLNL